MDNTYERAKALVADKKHKFLTYKIHTNKYFWDFLASWIVLVLKYEKLLYIKKFIILFSIVLSIYWPYYYKLHPITRTIVKREIIIREKQKSMSDFLNKLGYIESRNNYKIVNQFGYLGKYQLGGKALQQIGIKVPKEVFLEDEQLQETAIRLLLKNNKNTLKNYICQYDNKTIGGIYITESGILGAAHLAPQGVIQFLKSNGQKVFKDRNGTPITKYLKELSGYELTLE
jgi:hypothetical protein